MKNHSFVLGVLLLFCMACSNDQTSQDNKSSVSKNVLELKSPLGKVLAESESVLKKELLNYVSKKASKKISGEIVISEIEYSESEDVSIAIINFSIEGKEYSLLTPSFNKDEVMILQDQHTLRFVKLNSKKVDVKGDVLDFKPSKNIKYFEMLQVSNSAECINGDCCKWQTIVAGSEYNCGCKSTTTLTQAGDGIILTTSNGCKIQM